MGSMSTGETFTQEQIDTMTEEKREKMQIVELTPEDQQQIQGLNRQQKRDWMRANKKFSRRKR